MQVAGKLVVINPTQVVSEKFSKRTFVVEVPGDYPQKILLQLTQDKCGILQSYGIGDEIIVSINLRGREWNSPSGETKYFNTLEAWKIERVGGVDMNPKTTFTPSSKQSPVATPANEEEDDLPF